MNCRSVASRGVSKYVGIKYQRLRLFEDVEVEGRGGIEINEFMPKVPRIRKMKEFKSEQ